MVAPTARPADCLLVLSETQQNTRGDMRPACCRGEMYHRAGADMLSADELVKLGHRLAASFGTEFAALLGPGGAVREMKLAHETTGLSRLLEIERRTTKRVG